MSATAIRVERLGKRYRIGSRSRHHDRFGEWAMDRLAAPFRRAAGALRRRGAGASGDDTFWALQDVSFTIERGAVIGVIGRNGAGKSTILKILSRITEPTTGYADISGRVSSLLEVGTGFHPELTGRENIFLNGSILGLRRAEILDRFDRIVEFAEIEQFIDTPVKHYSSGMYVRLAFSVAAHLEPEILLVDEILAVGDLGFQKKCLARMDSISRQGRTVLLVTHNMNNVRRLCERTILLDRGRLAAFGPTSEVVEQYLSTASSVASVGTWIPVSQDADRGTGRVRVEAVRITGGALPTDQPAPMGPLEVVLRVVSDRRRTVDSVAVSLFDRYGTKLVNADTLALGQPISLRAGSNEVRFSIDSLYLNPGVYALGVWIADPPHEVYSSIPQVALIEVTETEQRRIRVPDDGLVPCRFDVLEPGAWHAGSVSRPSVELAQSIEEAGS